MHAFTIPGRPITKKNSGRIIQVKGRPMMIPSKKFKQYEKDAGHFLKPLKIAGPVEVTAHYYMPDRRSWPDLLGLLQSTADILEAHQVITNDRNIISLDNSRIKGVDKQNPRAEIYIKEVDKDG